MPATRDARLEILESAPPNSWVALAEDESKIIAFGSTYEEAVANSEKAGVKEPVIIKTPERWLPFAV
ncbi:MAG: hypothetical protein DMG66_01760 [Acidobacteria bacterium]|nr:MAG: hypothetical protein DMG66_01760 [Acidobacteriota bacterium]